MVTLSSGSWTIEIPFKLNVTREKGSLDHRWYVPVGKDKGKFLPIRRGNSSKIAFVSQISGFGPLLTLTISELKTAHINFRYRSHIPLLRTLTSGILLRLLLPTWTNASSMCSLTYCYNLAKMIRVSFSVLPLSCKRH